MPATPLLADAIEQAGLLRVEAPSIPCGSASYGALRRVAMLMKVERQTAERHIAKASSRDRFEKKRVGALK